MLGDILAASLKKQENSMKFVVKQERVTTVATTSFTPPEWMRLALAGEKINAIKALREISGRSNNRYDATLGRYVDGGWSIGLKEAKDIVESVTGGLSVSNERV
jgi:ribosomal protein L7/L12